MFKRRTTSFQIPGPAQLDMAEAFAITTGVLSRDAIPAIPAELLDHLAGPLRFYEEERAPS